MANQDDLLEQLEDSIEDGFEKHKTTIKKLVKKIPKEKIKAYSKKGMEEGEKIAKSLITSLYKMAQEGQAKAKSHQRTQVRVTSHTRRIRQGKTTVNSFNRNKPTCKICKKPIGNKGNAKRLKYGLVHKKCLAKRLASLR